MFNKTDTWKMSKLDRAIYVAGDILRKGNNTFN